VASTSTIPGTPRRRRLPAQPCPGPGQAHPARPPPAAAPPPSATPAPHRHEQSQCARYPATRDGRTARPPLCSARKGGRTVFVLCGLVPPRCRPGRYAGRRDGRGRVVSRHRTTVASWVVHPRGVPCGRPVPSRPVPSRVRYTSATSATPRTPPRSARAAAPRAWPPCNPVTAILRPAGHSSIAAACRHHARDATRT